MNQGSDQENMGGENRISMADITVETDPSLKFNKVDVGSGQGQNMLNQPIDAEALELASRPNNHGDMIVKETGNAKFIMSKAFKGSQKQDFDVEYADDPNNIPVVQPRTQAALIQQARIDARYPRGVPQQRTLNEPLPRDVNPNDWKTIETQEFETPAFVEITQAKNTGRQGCIVKVITISTEHGINVSLCQVPNQKIGRQRNRDNGEIEYVFGGR